MKLAATWESLSTQLPPSATSSELFSHFPPLIQLLVTAWVHSVPLQTCFGCDVPEVWGEKPCMSLSRWVEEVEEKGRQSDFYQLLYITSYIPFMSSPPSILSMFGPLAPQHPPSVQWQGGPDWLTGRSSAGTCSAYWNLLIINYSATHLSYSLSATTLWQVEERLNESLSGCGRLHTNKQNNTLTLYMLTFVLSLKSCPPNPNVTSSTPWLISSSSLTLNKSQ